MPPHVIPQLYLQSVSGCWSAFTTVSDTVPSLPMHSLQCGLLFISSPDSQVFTNQPGWSFTNIIRSCFLCGQQEEKTNSLAGPIRIYETRPLLISPTSSLSVSPFLLHCRCMVFCLPWTHQGYPHVLLFLPGLLFQRTSHGSPLFSLMSAQMSHLQIGLPCSIYLPTHPFFTSDSLTLL